jgi:hypothetical protein
MKLTGHVAQIGKQKLHKMFCWGYLMGKYLGGPNH